MKPGLVYRNTTHGFRMHVLEVTPETIKYKTTDRGNGVPDSSPRLMNVPAFARTLRSGNYVIEGQEESPDVFQETNP